MAAPDIELMRQHVASLFALDSAARLRSLNEPLRPQDHSASLVYVGRTGDAVLYHYRRDIPDGPSAGSGIWAVPAGLTGDIGVLGFAPKLRFDAKVP